MFAQKLESIIPNCKSFISTATDQTNVFAFDLFAKDHGFVIENIDQLAAVSNGLINNKEVSTFTYPSIFDLITKYKGYSNKIIFKNIDSDNCDNSLSVNISPFNIQNDKQLIIRICPICIGIGLNRNTSFKVLFRTLSQFLVEHNLSIKDISKIGSFKEKENEPGLKKLSEYLSIPMTFVSADSINSIDHSLSHSAATKFFNIKGVAEPSAIIISKYKTLFLKKHSYFREVTIAAAF
jgi:cobalt-precorrin 5A hydrolase